MEFPVTEKKDKAFRTLYAWQADHSGLFRTMPTAQTLCRLWDLCLFGFATYSFQPSGSSTSASIVTIGGPTRLPQATSLTDS